MSNPRQSVIAAFDFDGTLLRGDCLLLFHRLLKGRAGMVVDWMRLLPTFLAWKSGRRSTAWFKQHFLRTIIAGTDLQRRKQILDHELPQLLLQRLRPEAVTRLRWHSQQGHRLLIVSASPRDLICGLARALQSELIATETSPLGADPPNQPPQLSSANCKGMEKVRRLEALLGQPLAEVELHAYGDSQGDRELLQAARYPHWRSFTAKTRAYPSRWQALSSWVPLLGLLLLGLAITGLSHLDPAARQVLVLRLERLAAWLPAIYGVLGVAYLGRYWRWRLLLGSAGLGSWSWRDARAWFQGFALTATPGKLGELTRVAEIHQQLGYPRAPLLHAFFAERFCDLIAVGLWLLWLVPGTLSPQSSSAAMGPGLAGGLSAALLALAGLALIAQGSRQPWRRHLPSGAIARACLPAAAVSLGIWGCESVILWLLVQVVSPDYTITPSDGIRIYLLSGTAGMLSWLPGGLGVNEAATTLLLAQAGVPSGVAVVIAVLRRICTVWTITALALGQRLLQKTAG